MLDMVFQTFPLFQATPPAARVELAAQSKLIHRPRGHSLVTAGDPLTHVFFFLQGGAQAYNDWGEKRALYRIIHPGDTHGLGLFQVQTRHLMSVDLLTPCQIALVQVNALRQWLEKWPIAWADVARSATLQGIAMAEFFPRALHGTVPQRLALLLRRHSLQTPTDAPEYSLRITQTEMAEWIGASRETVCACLKDFEERKLIRREGHKIIVIRPEYFQEIWASATL